MNSCIWNGKRIDAFEIFQNEKLETDIRKAGSSGELKCLDPGCTSTIGYKHGPKKSPHFFHHLDSKCEYVLFEKSDRPGIRDVRDALYEHFKTNGYNVIREHNMPIGGKFCHLLFLVNGKSIVLQIADKQTSAQNRENLLKACKVNGYELCWIVIGNPDEPQSERHNYHIHRNLFNNSKNNDLIIINEAADRVLQTRIIKDSRFGITEQSFALTVPLERLVFRDGELSIDGFDDRFDQWYNNKIAEQERQKREEDARQKYISEHYTQKAQQHKASYQNREFYYPTHRPFPDSSQTYNNHTPNNDATPPVKIDYSKYKAGTRVSHDIYGTGIIANLDYGNKTVCIIFDEGGKHCFTIESLNKSDRFKFIT